MSITTIALAIAAAILVAWLWEKGKEPVIHRPLGRTNLIRLLDALLYRGQDASILTIQVESDDRCLIVTKYVRPSRVGLRIEIPSRPWAQAYLPALREHLSQVLTHRRATDESHGATASIAVDVGKDLELAEQIVRIVIERGFQVTLATEGIAYFDETLLPIEMPSATGISRSSS